MRIAAVAVALVLASALPAGTAAAEPPEVSGRVFARQTLIEAELDDTALPWRWEQRIASARLSVEYRYDKTVKTSVEVEFSDGEADMKDVWVRWRPRRTWELKAGRFKRPLSAVQLEGYWTLPIIERGLLSDIEFNGVTLPMGGRADGIALAWDPSRLPLEVQLAVFQPNLLASIDAADHFAADAYARVEMDVAEDIVWGTTFAWVSYLEKPDQQEGFRHAPVVGLDVTVTRRRFRLWADVVAGADVLPFAIDVATLDLPCVLDEEGDAADCPPVELIADRGLFLAARGVASVRFEPEWIRTVEPFVSVSIVDLNTRYKDDEANQIGAGLALRINKRLRAQLQADRTSAHSEAPVNEVTRVMLQLGAAF